MKIDTTLIEAALKEGRDFLLENEALKVFESIGVSFPQNQLTKTVSAAITFAKKIGYPVVIKGISPKILHKSDYNAVVVGIKDDSELKQKFNQMQEQLKKYNLTGILVEKQVKKGIELLIGTNIDYTFGPIVALGIGGVLVEAIKDVTFSLCPTTKNRALEMINELKTQKMLNGFRGMPAVNREALADMIVKVAQLAYDLTTVIKEIDLNPVIANEDGIFGVDARIILQKK